MSGEPRRYGPRLRTAEKTTIVELTGDVDILARPRLTAALDGLTDAPCPDLLLDLTRVTFLDCSGLSVLNRARLRAKDGAGRLRLVVTDPSIRRTLRITGLARLFDTYDDIDSALASGNGGHVDRQRIERLRVHAP